MGGGPAGPATCKSTTRGSVQRAPILILHPSQPQTPAGADGPPAKAAQNCRGPPSRAPAGRAPLVRPSGARPPGLLQVGGRRRGGRVRYGPDSHPAVEAGHKVHLPRMVRCQVSAQDHTPKTARLSFCLSVCLLVIPPPPFPPPAPSPLWGRGADLHHPPPTPLLCLQLPPPPSLICIFPFSPMRSGGHCRQCPPLPISNSEKGKRPSVAPFGEPA